MTALVLPRRRGPQPTTNTPGIPHTQLDQHPEAPEPGDELTRRIFSLAGIEERPSIISVPGARALWMTAGEAGQTPGAFLREREFAHVHPDGSLHLTLPRPDAEAAIEAGWAEWHPYALTGQLPPTAVLVFAPRDTDEVGVVEQLVHRSWRFAMADPAP